MLRAYLDGDSELFRPGGGGPTTASTSSITNIDTDDPLTIGAVRDGALVRNSFDGLIDDARIYQRVLSDAEVAVLASGGTRLEPNVSASPSASIISAREPLTLTLNADNARPHRWFIDWGDGTTESFSGQERTRSHTFAEAGSPQEIEVAAQYGGETFDALILAGGLQAAFGTDGRTSLDTGSPSWVRDGVVQPDGKLVVAGGPDFTLARFHPDGSPDLAFGSSGTGVAEASVAGEGRAVALQGDGRIVVVGGSFFSIARFNADGSLDTTFGTGGVVDDSFGSSYEANGVAVQADGNIVVAGDGGGDFVLARFLPDGTRDLAFGGSSASDGRVKTDFAGGRDSGNALAIGSDGRLIVTGRTAVAGSSDYDIAVAAYTREGVLDPSFSGDGKAAVDLGDDDETSYDVAVQPDGKIVAVGRTRTSDANSYDFATVRLNRSGSMDAGFGTAGRVTTHLGRGADAAYGVVVTSGGGLLVGGRTSGSGTDNHYDYGLIRLEGDGTLDRRFGRGGISTIDFDGRRDDADALAIGATGQLFVIGRSGDEIGVAAVAGFDLPAIGSVFEGEYAG